MMTARQGAARRDNSLRVLAIIPGSEAKSSFIFARRQMSMVAECGVDVQLFWLGERTSPAGLFGELKRLRAEIARSQPDIVHAHYGTVTAFVAALAGGPPLVITYRGSDLNGSPEVSKLRSRAGVLMSQLAALRATRIISVSERLSRILWWRRQDTVVIPSGVDTQVFRPMPRAEARAVLGWALEERIILFNSGSRAKLKRLDIAEAAAAETARLVRNSRLEVLHGGVDPAQIAVYMNAADCLLLASDAEGSPNVIKEALACNLPIVSVDVGDVRERMEGVTPGAIVERESSALGRAMASIIETPTRSNGHAAIVDISTRRVAERIIDVYRAVLGSR